MAAIALLVIVAGRRAIVKRKKTESPPNMNVVVSDQETKVPIEKSSTTSSERSSVMTTVETSSGITYNVTKQAARQIQRYRQGTGLILNLHITHHGGTTVCHAIGHSPDASGTAPSRACNNPKPQDNITDFPSHKPWTKDNTAHNIEIVRKHFHMVGWEFGFKHHIPRPNLNVTDWENPNLLSIIVMRDPMSRLLASSGFLKHNYPDIRRGNATRKVWWKYANDSWFTNNYELRVLAGHGCCNGAQTDPQHLENAKTLVERFSIVLDIQCLTEGLDALSNLLNITLAKPNPRKANKPHQHAPTRERVGYDDVYEFLMEKNRLDIELYEWSKSFALIDCSKIQRENDD